MLDSRWTIRLPWHLGRGIAVGCVLAWLGGCTTITDRVGTIDTITIQPLERVFGQDINEASDRVAGFLVDPVFWQRVHCTADVAGREFVRVAQQPVRDPSLYDDGQPEFLDDYDTFLLQDQARSRSSQRR